MTDTPTQDRSVVLTVVAFVGLIALVGLVGIILLVHEGVDPVTIALVSQPVGVALGVLGGLLAHTATAQPVKAAAEAVGFQKAVDAVNALGAAEPAPEPSASPSPAATAWPGSPGAPVT